jgi:NAD(P) transhydrogenase subunit alpha
MPLIIAVARERAPGESRVALVPETAKKFAALGASLRMEQSAGAESHFLDYRLC